MDGSDPRFGTMLGGSSKVNNETYKLIETLQYHTLLIGLNVFIELTLFVIAWQVGLSAIGLSLSIFVDIWCLLFMFRKQTFKRYCNYCLKCTKPCWRCCGINRPEFYDNDINELGRTDMYSTGKIDNEYYYDQNNNMNMGNMMYQQSDSSTVNDDKKRSTIWSKISWSKNNKSSKKRYMKQSSNSSMNNDLYQPLTQQYGNDYQQYQWEV